ncbi:thioredoxin domain-containing protein 9-like [Dendronephthya gigantea]|uniref:thioredoxin domain-containing protein 9-like n=1 Tax=Dendronephthya gigantea TaxID=151771 RepID=UPI00106904D5|nr:thioredoxin domain-containing protein 9-like [Dendronephthya gigantea]
MAAQGNIESLIEQKVLEAASIVEEQIDSELNRLENLKEDDIDVVRERRLQQLKKQQVLKQELRRKGHGEYREIADEKDFFAVCKESDKVICHFYRESTWRCKIVDKHLTTLAPKHIEAKFIKIDAEKSPFLVKRLRVVVLPTIALIKDSKTVDFIVGFDDLGGSDDFPCEMLEWRIACAGVIDYNGDISQPPDPKNNQNSTKKLFQQQKKIIRGGGDSDEDSD